MTDEVLPFERLVAHATGECSAEESADIERYVDAHAQSGVLLEQLQQLLETMRTDDSESAGPAAVARAKNLSRALRRAALREQLLGQLAGTVRRVVASLVFDSRSAGLTPGFRSGGATVRLAYEQEGCRVELQIDPAHDGPDHEPFADRFRIRGQLSPAPGTGAGEVILIGPDEDPSTVRSTVDEHGWFAMHSRGGAYDLTITHSEQDRVIVVPGMDIGPARN